MVKILFVTPFETRYQRNNKRTGQKNLRCFPQCNVAGHMASGFCGLPITCRITETDLPELHDIKTYGEFLPCSSEVVFKPETEYDEAELIEKERTRTKPTLPYLKGDLLKIESGKIQVSFNSQLLGWHYHWISTKHTCDSFHLFRAYLFYRNQENGKLVFIASEDSSRFQLYSRRRQRGVSQMEAFTEVNKRRHNIKSKSPIAIKDESMSALTRLKGTALAFKESVQGGLLSSLLAAKQDIVGSNGLSMPKFPPLAMLRLKFLSSMSDSDSRNHCLTSARLTMFMLHFNLGANSFSLGNDPKQKPSNVPIEGGSQTDEFSTWEGLADLLGGSFPEADGVFDNSALFQGIVEPVRIGRVPDIPHLGDLRGAVKETADAGLIRDLEESFNFINTLSQLLLEEHVISEDLNKIFSKYATPENIENIALQVKEEETLLKEADLNRDLELEYHKQMLQHMVRGTVPDSLFEQVRFTIVRHIMHYLFSRRRVPGFMYRPMEFAARKRFLPFDSEVTPSPLIASFVRLQLSSDFDATHVDKFEEEFTSDMQRLKWRRMTVAMKRKQLRWGVINRLKREMKFKQTHATSLTQSMMTPVNAGIDLNGSWNKVEDMESFTARVCKLLDLAYGTLPARLIEVMFSKLKVTMSQKTLLIQGKQKLLTDSNMLFQLDGFFHDLLVPSPFPLPTKHACRKYCAWIEKVESKLVLRIVAGSFSVPVEAQNRLLADLFGNAVTRQEVKDQFPPGYSKSIVLAVEVQLAADKMTFDATASTFSFLPNDGNLPATKSKLDVLSLFQDLTLLAKWDAHIMTHRFRYFKIFDDNQGLEDLLQLV